MLLEDRVAVVTGAGRGIGAAVARYLAAQGARVVVNDLGVALDGADEPDSTLANEVVEEIVAAGGTAIANAADVSDHEAAGKLIGAAVEEFGRLDVLVNAAGIVRDRMIFNMTPEEWDAVIAVHLRGTFNTAKHAAVHWRAAEGEDRRLINFASLSGLRGNPGQPNYAAAKLGVVGLTYSCANALSRYGVTSNALAPGAATRMTQSVPDERKLRPDEGDERSPDNIGPSIAYLASERSGWLNGRILEARGYEVTLWSNPEPMRQVRTTGPWEIDALCEAIEASFRPAIEQTNRYQSKGQQ